MDARFHGLTWDHPHGFNALASLRRKSPGSRAAAPSRAAGGRLRIASDRRSRRPLRSHRVPTRSACPAVRPEDPTAPRAGLSGTTNSHTEGCAWAPRLHVRSSGRQDQHALLQRQPTVGHVVALRPQETRHRECAAVLHTRSPVRRAGSQGTRARRRGRDQAHRPAASRDRAWPKT
jgi:hypothetical protein